MNIPALSMSLSQVNLGNQISIAMLSKSLDTAEAAGAAMIDMMNKSMELSINPNIGGNIDLSV